MKLIFLNRFFHPDHSATSQMLSDLAFALAQRGWPVCVITSRLRYDGPVDRLPPRETVDGVSVHRVWTSRFGRANLLGRSIDYATFYLAAAWQLWRLARSGDVVVAKTDPPMVSVIALPVCWLRGARLVNWLQDIFPEAAQALGVGGRTAQLPYHLLRWLRNASLKAACMNVVVGERVAECVAEMGVARQRIRLIPNWADGRVIAPIDREANTLSAEWDLDDAFVVAYSGNLGRAHDSETLLEAMTSLPGMAEWTISTGGAPERRPVLWFFIGSGALIGPLKAEVARRGLTSVLFKPYQAKAQLAQSLSAANVHLVSLLPELEGLIVPSKFYGIAAAGRPTIFVGDKDGEIARLIARHKCGRTIAVGDGAGLAQAIAELAAQPGLCRLMGENARRAFEAEFDRPIAMARWQNLLLEIGNFDVLGSHCDTSAARDPARSPRNAR
jgi:colanic acid biosynthesis glycosyl transferase WcaI